MPIRLQNHFYSNSKHQKKTIFRKNSQRAKKPKIRPSKFAKHFSKSKLSKKVPFDQMNVFRKKLINSKIIGATACRAWLRAKTFNGVQHILQYVYILGPKTIYNYQERLLKELRDNY